MRKVQFLDGLRGLAAFVVVLHHFILAFYPALFFGLGNATHLKNGFEALVSVSFVNILYNGNFAVCLFFVLSGFVLSHKFFLEKDIEIVTESAIKRYARLFIPVSVSILFAFILMKFSLFSNQQISQISGSSWFSGFWNFDPNFWNALYEALWGSFFADTFEYNVVLWTISLELFGSFLVFAFLALFGKMQNRYWIYGVAILVFLQTYYLAFILGMLLSDLSVNKKKFFKKKNVFIFVPLLFLGLFFGSHLSGQSTEGTIYAFLKTSFFSDSSISWHIIGAFLTIAAILNLKRIQKILSFRFFLFLGTISFPMYLLHFSILGSFSGFVFLKLEPYLSYNMNFLVSFCLSVILIFLLSFWMHVLVDIKAVRFSKRIYVRFFKKKSLESVS